MDLIRRRAITTVTAVGVLLIPLTGGSLVRAQDAKPVAAAPAAASKPDANEKTLLVYKAQAGQTARYKSEGTLSVEAGGNKAILDLKQIDKVTFTGVSASGEITRERKTESSEVSFNGQKAPTGGGGDDDSKTVETIVSKPDGTLVSYKSTSKEADDVKQSVRLEIAQTPIFPNKPIGVGDKWTQEYKGDATLGSVPAQGDYEVLAQEKISGIDTLKIKMNYREKSGSPAIVISGTVWIEKASGDAVVADLNVEGVKLGGEDGPVASGKIRGERIEGGPLAGSLAVKSEPKKDKNIDDTVKEFEKIGGLLTLYRKKEAGRETLYAEIREDQLDKLMLLQATASTGTGEQVVAGDPLNDLVFKFSRQGDDKLLMVTPNYNFRAKDNTPIARAVRRSFADAYIQAFKIEAKQAERKSLLIDVSDFFKGDVAQIMQAFSGAGTGASLGRGGAGFGPDREKTYITSLKNFPENLVVETQYNFARMGGGRGDGVLADPRSAPFKVTFNLLFLPEGSSYAPRTSDPRIGFFETEYQSFDDDSKSDPMVRYILRWNLKKKDPTAKLSEPVKPIVFWLDNAIPTEYRKAVGDGVLMWNKAFEKIGYKNAIVVKQMPDNADWDHADMRYNVVRWVTSPDPGSATAIAQFRANPLTGEILNASITVESNWTNLTKSERKELVSPAARFDRILEADARVAAAEAEENAAGSTPNARNRNFLRCQIGAAKYEQARNGLQALSLLAGPAGLSLADEKAYVDALIREVVAHEMGHIMGLRHNFIASTYHTLDELKNADLINRTGIAASLMDYTPFNIAALKQKNVPFFTPTVGPYDIWAIEYGYKPNADLKAIARRSNEPGHAYQSDELAIVGFDPMVSVYDLSSDPLAFQTRQIQLARYLLMNLQARAPRNGESYFEFTRRFYSLLSMLTGAAADATTYLGALTVNRNHKGDPGEKPTLVPVDAAKQKQALALLNTYIFAPNAFAFPKSYYTHLAGSPYGLPNEFPIRDTFANAQRGALRSVFSAGVLRRIANNEFKVADPSQALTLPTLFSTVGASIWTELGAPAKTIDPLRRQLQRAHIDLLADMVLRPGIGIPEDARMLAGDQLRQLRGRIATARRTAKTSDTYTRVHLDDSLQRIDRTLNATMTLGGGGGGGAMSLQQLLGGKTAP